MPTEGTNTKGIRPNESSGSLESAVFTLDPQHKYLTPRPSARKTEAPDKYPSARKVTSGRAYAQIFDLAKYKSERPKESSRELSPALSPSPMAASRDRSNSFSHGFRHSSLLAVFHRLRGTKSAEHERDRKDVNLVPETGEVSSSIAGIPALLKRVTKSAGNVGFKRNHCFSSATATALPTRNIMLATPKHAHESESHSNSAQLHQTSGNIKVPPNAPEGRSYEPVGCRISGSHGEGDVVYSTPSTNPGRYSSPREFMRPLESPIGQPRDKRSPQVRNERHPHSPIVSNQAGNPSISDECTRQSSLDEFIDGIRSLSLGLLTSRSGSLSPCYLPEAQSPLWPDFDQQHNKPVTPTTPPSHEGQDWPSWSTATLAARASSETASSDKSFSQAYLSSYNLPQSEEASVSTIKMPQANPFQTILNPTILSNHIHQDDSQGWDNTSRYHMTALEELVVDLGYLGQAIT